MNPHERSQPQNIRDMDLYYWDWIFSSAVFLIVISLPYPPTVNTYYTVARGRKILSTVGRSFKKQALLWMMEQNVPKGRDGAYAVMIHMMPPDNRKRDVDNIIKPVLDSLVEYGVIPDDSMIYDLRVQRFDVVKGGALTVNVCRE